MAIDDFQMRVWQAEFEKLGVERIRERLAAGQYDVHTPRGEQTLGPKGRVFEELLARKDRERGVEQRREDVRLVKAGNWFSARSLTVAVGFFILGALAFCF